MIFRHRSKLAQEAERELVEATQRLTPEERLNAYLVHCQLVMELYQTGQKLRASPEESPARKPPPGQALRLTR
jgi:hypothetical protein